MARNRYTPEELQFIIEQADLMKAEHPEKSVRSIFGEIGHVLGRSAHAVEVQYSVIKQREKEEVAATRRAENDARHAEMDAAFRDNAIEPPTVEDKPLDALQYVAAHIIRLESEIERLKEEKEKLSSTNAKQAERIAALESDALDFARIISTARDMVLKTGEAAAAEEPHPTRFKLIDGALERY